MALQHASPGQIIDLVPAVGGLPAAGSFALFKSDHLELIRLALPAGKTFPPHRVPGEVTLQCLSGTLDITIDDVPQRVVAGQLLHVGAGVTHGVLAVEDAAALLTIVLRRP